MGLPITLAAGAAALERLKPAPLVAAVQAVRLLPVIMALIQRDCRRPPPAVRQIMEAPGLERRAQGPRQHLAV